MSIAFRSFAGILVTVLAAFSGTPKIDFEKTIIECGTIVDGTKDKLHASFAFKNTGDGPLRIMTVRPSCLCTIVKFDTLVMPGKTSVIEATVNISTYHSGSISKPVTVTSDASNLPTIQLAIKATIQPVIDVSEQFVDLYISKAGMAHSIFLSCAKKDLRVTDVIFNQNKTQDALWKDQISLPIKSSLTPLDSIRGDGYRVFKLDLIVPAAPEELKGVLSLKTNDPAKPELTLQCVINK